MSASTLLAYYEQLPDNYQQEVSDFIEFLFLKIKQPLEPKEQRRNLFGSLKGKIEMSDDFDEPLEEFKDYM